MPSFEDSEKSCHTHIVRCLSLDALLLKTPLLTVWDLNCHTRTAHYTKAKQARTWQSPTQACCTSWGRYTCDGSTNTNTVNTPQEKIGRNEHFGTTHALYLFTLISWVCFLNQILPISKTTDATEYIDGCPVRLPRCIISQANFHFIFLISSVPIPSYWDRWKSSLPWAD